MLTEGAKLLVNEVDFMDSLLVLNLPEPICKALCEVIIEIQDQPSSPARLAPNYSTSE
jgi:hypothetical protein